MQQIPKTVKWIAVTVLIFFILLSIFRFLFFIEYKPGSYSFPSSAFLMGARIDLRSVCILGLLMTLLTAFPALNPFKNRGSSVFWNFFLSFLFTVALLFYLVDFFHFDILHRML